MSDRPVLRVVPGLQDQAPEEAPRHYGRVSCTDGVHEILISRITGRYAAGRQPQAFRALCEQVVQPADGDDTEGAELCKRCPNARKAMEPKPVYWGDLRQFTLTLAAMLGGESGSG